MNLYARLQDDRPKLILEIGLNHNGSRELASRMLRAAHAAGAFAVKFQTYRTAEFISPGNRYYPLFESAELSASDLLALKREADRLGLVMFSTANEPSILPRLVRMGNPIYKLSSTCLTHFPLIQAVCRVAGDRPIILSTGAAYLDEVGRAVRWFRERGKDRLVLLCCTSEYPVRPARLNLRRIGTLRESFQLPVGLSDHSPDDTAAVLALALGCRLFEKHFTLDRSLPGPDHHFSITPDDARRLVRTLAAARLMLGDGAVRPTLGEEPMRRLGRRYLVAARDLRQGTRLRRQDVACKRTTTPAAISPEHHDAVIGMRLGRAVRKDAGVRWSDLR